MADIRTAITPGIIARELKEPIHRVLHVLRTRTHIKPTARAGMIRLYEFEAVAQVREELKMIDGFRNADSSRKPHET